MGSDEYHPISKKGENLLPSGGIGYTVADAIDTMYLMGLGPEYQRARTWIETKLSFDQKGSVSTSEVRFIRHKQFTIKLTICRLQSGCLVVF